MDKKENIEAAQEKERKPGRNWKESHVILFMLPVLCIVLVPLGGLLYLYGRLSLHPGFAVCMFYPATGVFIIYCFFASIVGLIADWRRCTWTKRVLITTEVSLPIVFVVSFVMMFPPLVESQVWPDAMPFTYGFRDRIRSKADIPAIRTWLRTLDEDDFSDFDERLDSAEWPESLRMFKGESVMLGPDKAGKPRIRIILGAAIFHWGATIGLEDMVIPPSDLDEFYESSLLVEPGVYVWDF